MAKFKAGASKGKAGPAPKSAESVQRSIMDSAQQIWHAGMGAFGRAQEEGTKLFESLVREGSSLESKTRRMASGRVDAVRDAVENRVGAVKERAADTWDRLEKVFEDRVQRALTRLGVPGRDDLRELSARVDALNAQLRDRRASRGAAPSADTTRQGAKKKPAAKAAAKAAPARRRRIKDLTQ